MIAISGVLNVTKSFICFSPFFKNIHNRCQLYHLI
jgi:hypothetical protein